MGNHGTPPTTDDDDWDKDFEGGFDLHHSPPHPPVPPLPPLSPKKHPASPRKLSPPKTSTGNVSDDNSKTIRPAAKTSQRHVSAESNGSSASNTVRAVSVSPLPPPLPTGQHKTIPRPTAVLKKRSKSRGKVPRDESSDDGYEDLIKGDESKFAQKVNSLKVIPPKGGGLLIVEGYFGVAAVVVSVGFKVVVTTLDHDPALAIEFACRHIAVITDAEST
jgi:hypothetical protein